MAAFGDGKNTAIANFGLIEEVMYPVGRRGEKKEKKKRSSGEYDFSAYIRSQVTHYPDLV